MKENIFCLSIFLLLFSACQEVINIDLNTSDPKIVIDASIADTPPPYSVKVNPFRKL